MTREEELAALLAQIGLERGVGVEQLADALARMTLPEFVDERAFRDSLVAALERQLRTQFEQQISSIRERMHAAPPSASASQPSAGAAAPAPNPVSGAPAAMSQPASSSARALETAPAAPPAGWIPERQEVAPFAAPAAPPAAGQAPASPAELELPEDATIYWAPEDERKPR